MPTLTSMFPEQKHAREKTIQGYAFGVTNNFRIQMNPGSKVNCIRTVKNGDVYRICKKLIKQKGKLCSFTNK